MREIEWEIVPAAQDAGLGLLPWSPLGGGWLSGKYRRDQRPDRRHPARGRPEPRHGGVGPARHRTRTWDVIDAVQQIAEDRGVTMAEVALAWVTDRPAVTSTILGARTLEQLETNLRRGRPAPDADETAALDAASDPHATDYPYGELGARPAQPHARRGPLTRFTPLLCDRPAHVEPTPGETGVRSTGRERRAVGG